MCLNDLIELLRKSDSFAEIDKYRDEIAELIPKVIIMFDYDQEHYAHQYDLWEHSIMTVLGLTDDIDDDMTFLAALLHDIGKPDCRIYAYEHGEMKTHFPGHPKRSMEIVRDEIIPDLLKKGEPLSEKQIKMLLYYVEYHDEVITLKPECMQSHLNIGVSLSEFKNLMKLHVSDAKAHNMVPFVINRIDICGKLSGEYADRVYKELKESTKGED